MKNTSSSMDNKSIIQSPPLVLPTWTNHDHSLFLHAVPNGPDNIDGRRSELASAIPGKTADELKAYYEAVERGLLEIEAGQVQLPQDDDIMSKEEQWVPNTDNELLATVIGSKRVRRKYVQWTEDEHRRFLQGLEVYGKGNWRSISRNMVVTKTAKQVVSHATSYFLRQASLKKDNNNNNNNNNNNKKRKKRSSVNDITTADAVVQARLSSSSSSTTTLNGGGQGRGEPAVVPTTSSHSGSRGRGGQSSLTIRPGVNGVDNIDGNVVVHAQPILLTPPATSTLYGGSEGRSVPIAVSQGRGRGGQAPGNFYSGQGREGQVRGNIYGVQGREGHAQVNFYGGQGREGQAPGNLYGGQGRGGQAPGNFYGGQGRGGQTAGYFYCGQGRGQASGNFFGGQGGGAPQTLNSFYGGHGGGAPSHPTTLPPTHFYGEQGQAPPYEFSRHSFLDEDFSFKK